MSSTQLPALPQGSTGTPLVLAVNDRLRRIAQTASTTTTAVETAQTAADAAQSSADEAAKNALQAAKNLSDVPDKLAARTNLAAVSRIVIGNDLGTASATYSQTQMAEVIAMLGTIITALDA
jgi:hypothetical protein